MPSARARASLPHLPYLLAERGRPCAGAAGFAGHRVVLGDTSPVEKLFHLRFREVLELLEQLSETQVEELFDGARVAKYDAVANETRSARAWAAAFSEKVRQVREAGPCASARHLP